MEMESDSEERRVWMLRHEQMLAKLGADEEDPRRETTTSSLATTSSVRLEDTRRGSLLDALRRHREILRRETDILREEVASRGFATFAGKKAYMEETQYNGRTTVSPPLPFSDESESREIKSVGVSLPHLVTRLEESLALLLHESHHLRYRIQSLVSILTEFGIPVSSDKAKMMMMFLMSRASMIISKTMQNYSKGATSSRHLHRVHWESVWRSTQKMDSNGVFDDITTLSPMLYTPTTPGISPCSAFFWPSALQIYSLKIVQLHPKLNWPLRVYGIVAARDHVDHNRNILFYRSSDNYQLVTENDPFLRLTGPSRAIVAANDVTFEVELKIKYPGAEGRQDTAFFYRTRIWRSARDTTPLLQGYACSAELSLEVIPRAIQATIVGVRLVGGSWPPTYGCRVSCSLSSDAEDEDEDDPEVELLNCSSLDDVKKGPVGSDGYFGLARNVVSAELESTLKVSIQAIGGPHNHVEFDVEQYCQTSKASCFVAGCEVEVIVAWSSLSPCE